MHKRGRSMPAYINILVLYKYIFTWKKVNEKRNENKSIYTIVTSITLPT